MVNRSLDFVENLITRWLEGAACLSMISHTIDNLRCSQRFNSQKVHIVTITTMNKTSLITLFFLSSFVTISFGQGLGKASENLRVGPIVPQSVGEIWPKPEQQFRIPGRSLLLDEETFNFQVTGKTCEILERALERYIRIIGTVAHKHNGRRHGENSTNEYLDTLQVYLTEECEFWPRENMDESYTLLVSHPLNTTYSQLRSQSVWGILRGLETFSQLLFWNGDNIQVNGTEIFDSPRFPHRSLLLDSSRHFLPKQTIYDNLDLMSMVKLNILHWHITDNEAFPFQSDGFPNLSLRGSFHAVTHEYTKQDVRDIIEYARVRGIRVIPEFDTPGHTQSWGPGQPGLLTPCYTNGTIDGTFGHVNPANEDNYVFFREFFREILDTFPDAWIHLGGDEVGSECWDSNPEVREFMELHDFGNDYTLLEDYHMHRLVDIVKELSPNSTQMGWQEVFFNNHAAPKDMIVHIWILEELADQLYNVTEAGYRTLLGSCWYLDHISYGVDWHKYYNCDPHNFNGTEEQKKLVIGGGPNFWAEYIDENNLIPLLWPRAAVPAERLWSPITANSIQEAAPRLEEFRCKLLRRGYRAQPPNGAGFCL